MASTPILLTVLMLSLLFILNQSFSCPSHHKQALLNFKSTLTAIINSTSDLDSWNPTSDCCTWQRVNCSRTGYVVELHLYNLVPHPEINPNPVFSQTIAPLVHITSDILNPLFRIRSLELLDISFNSLQGEIPGDGFGNLTKLVHLDLMQNKFNGSIPSQLFKLTNLRYLDMSSNLLNGKLGPELGSLRNLITLNLKRNHFFGSIPLQLFELNRLQFLDLSDNILEGGLSPRVGKLQSLDSLFVGANFLSGNIPEEIGNLTKLTTLSLQNNHFFGGIPSSFVNLKSLDTLDLSKNSFSMQIPAFIGTLANMTALDLSHNKFTGQIPSSMQNLSELIILRIHDNMLKGEILNWLFNITTLKKLFIGGKGDNLIWNNKAKIVPRCNLRHMSMRYCGISGDIHELVSPHTDLIFLDLSMNTLEGRFPDWLAEKNLQIIFLSDNNLSGSLPSRVFESVELMILDLSRNNFSGELPENIGNARSIYGLHLSENHFSGQIPITIWMSSTLGRLDLSRNKFYSDNLLVLGDNSNLEVVDLSYNEFSGKLPTNFSKGLNFLYLAGNKFCGNLPLNLNKLVNLKLFDVHENNITGNLQDTLPQIPTLEALILRKNFLRGHLPNNVSNLTSLRILDISHNNLTGSIPPEIANLPRMIETTNLSTPFPISYPILFSTGILDHPDFVVNWKKSFQGIGVDKLETYVLLDLSSNGISGEIPSSLGNLKALKLLNISHNRISRHIPTSFGDLQNIESLDLSHNEISGSIPQSLVKLSQLTVLDLRYNRLTGKIPDGGQMGTMTDFDNNTGLCGIQIGVTCPRDHIRPVEGTHDEDESWFLWEGTLVGFPVGFLSIFIMGYFLDFLQFFKI